MSPRLGPSLFAYDEVVLLVPVLAFPPPPPITHHHHLYGGGGSLPLSYVECATSRGAMPCHCLGVFSVVCHWPGVVVREGSIGEACARYA